MVDWFGPKSKLCSWSPKGKIVEVVVTEFSADDQSIDGERLVSLSNEDSRLREVWVVYEDGRQKATRQIFKDGKPLLPPRNSGPFGVLPEEEFDYSREVSLKIRPIPTPKSESAKISFRFNSDETVTLKGIALRSRKGLDKNFEEQKKAWDDFGLNNRVHQACYWTIKDQGSRHRGTQQRT